MNGKYMARKKFFVPKDEIFRDYRRDGVSEDKGLDASRFWFVSEFVVECDDSEDYVEPGFFVDRERL
jgi:hypothetical protein